MNDWIDVHDRLPETDGLNTRDYNVLVYIPEREGVKQKGGVYIGKLREVEPDPDGLRNFWRRPSPGSDWTVWGWSYFEEPCVTHWMPLPEPPKMLGVTKAAVRP